MVVQRRRFKPHKDPIPVGTYLCPLCGLSSRTEVKDSRPGPLGYPRRRRYCNNCKGNFTTVEIPVEMFVNLDLTGLASKAAEAMTNAVNQFKVLRRALNDAAKR